MLFVYNIFTILLIQILKFISIFLSKESKIKIFIDSRKFVFDELENKIKPSDNTIWFHVSSQGEYEQGLPVIEKIKVKYPNHKIVLTFFSTSGKENKLNNKVADVTVFLPLDTKRNARKFIELVHPEKAFFIKYDFWANYLTELKRNNIPTYLISGIFRKEQLFFKWYGGFYRKILSAFTCLFLQNEESRLLLEKIGIKKTIVSGDTRFDRVAEILKKDNTLDFITEFKNNSLLIVAGCVWEKDEELLVEYINTTKHNVKIVLSPRRIIKERVEELRNSFINKKVVLFSEMEGKNLSSADVFIADTMGILTKIYSYADIAYVGGGFRKKGIHNILEPAVFGTPLLIGTNYKKFTEAVKLVSLGGCVSISNFSELKETLDLLISDNNIREEKGKICETYIKDNMGTTEIIMKNIKQ